MHLHIVVGEVIWCLRAVVAAGLPRGGGDEPRRVRLREHSLLGERVDGLTDAAVFQFHVHPSKLVAFLFLLSNEYVVRAKVVCIHFAIFFYKFYENFIKKISKTFLIFVA